MQKLNENNLKYLIIIILSLAIGWPIVNHIRVYRAINLQVAAITQKINPNIVYSTTYSPRLFNSKLQFNFLNTNTGDKYHLNYDLSYSLYNLIKGDLVKFNIEQNEFNMQGTISLAGTIDSNFQFNKSIVIDNYKFEYASGRLLYSNNSKANLDIKIGQVTAKFIDSELRLTNFRLLYDNDLFISSDNLNYLVNNNDLLVLNQLQGKFDLSINQKLTADYWLQYSALQLVDANYPGSTLNGNLSTSINLTNFITLLLSKEKSILDKDTAFVLNSKDINFPMGSVKLQFAAIANELSTVPKVSLIVQAPKELTFDMLYKISEFKVLNSSYFRNTPKESLVDTQQFKQHVVLHMISMIDQLMDENILSFVGSYTEFSIGDEKFTPELLPGKIFPKQRIRLN